MNKYAENVKDEAPTCYASSNSASQIAEKPLYLCYY